MNVEIEEPVSDWVVGDLQMHDVYLFPPVEGEKIDIQSVFEEIDTYIDENFEVHPRNRVVIMKDLAKAVVKNYSGHQRPFHLDVVMWRDWQRKDLGHSVIRFVIFPYRRQWDDNSQFEDNIVEYES